MFIGEHIKAVIRLLDEKPQEWSADKYTIDHGRTGINIWYCSGLWFMKFWGKYQATPVSFLEKWALKRATQRWRRAYQLVALQKALEQA